MKVVVRLYLFLYVDCYSLSLTVDPTSYRSTRRGLGGRIPIKIPFRSNTKTRDIIFMHCKQLKIRHAMDGSLKWTSCQACMDGSFNNDGVLPAMIVPFIIYQSSSLQHHIAHTIYNLLIYQSPIDQYNSLSIIDH